MEMKDNAPGVEMPNGAELGNRKPIYYGNLHFPNATNEAAKKCDAAKIMREVTEAR